MKPELQAHHVSCPQFLATTQFFSLSYFSFFLLSTPKVLFLLSYLLQSNPFFRLNSFLLCIHETFSGKWLCSLHLLNSSLIDSLALMNSFVVSLTGVFSGISITCETGLNRQSHIHVWRIKSGGTPWE